MRISEALSAQVRDVHVVNGVARSVRVIGKGNRERLVPAGYLGRPDEIWLARVLPPPSAEFRDRIVITTPYVIVRPRAPGWYAFLERTLPKLKCPTPYEAYAGAETSAVFLRGLPDIDLSRPHSRQTQALLNGAHGVESRHEGD